jgi:putative membrane-bound dehydrogenase-like protein
MMNPLLLCTALLSTCVEDPIETPHPADDRLVVELIAREPEIVTPTGVAVDERGRIWVIENQTHHRPAEYKGPAGDRIRIYDDFALDGRARRVTTFAEGFKNGMGLAIARDGSVYFATRSEIMVLGSSSVDVATDKQTIVRLDTAGDYPHNGLSGFAFDAFDNVYFGFGENLGASYQLIGSDGTMLSGGGEGGNIYRCRPDGSKLVRVATGFWNPFHMTFDAFGRLFAVDNDPDSRPPCRLLHIIPGGDYGYRFRNGRKGLHPFTAWNGELPGTLPMVAGTGEAPSGIVAYESNGLPDEYRGDLIVTSWGDHIIQRFKLAERGASFTSQPQTMIRGGESFYPVGIATAPDGSLVVTDWADKSYPLHGKGRIWRIRTKESPPDDGLRPSQIATQDSGSLIKSLGHPNRSIRDAATAALSRNKANRDLLATVLASSNDTRASVHALWALHSIDSKALITRRAFFDKRPEVRAAAVQSFADFATEERDQDELGRILTRDKSDSVRLQALLGLHAPGVRDVAFPFLAHEDPFLAAAALEFFGRLEHVKFLQAHATDGDSRVRLGILLALRRSAHKNARKLIPTFLEDADPGVRRTALQWVGEERIVDYEPERVLSVSPLSRDVFEAYLAAKEMHAGVTRKPTEEPSGEDLVVKILADPTQNIAVQSWALYSVRPDHPALTTAMLKPFLGRDKSQALKAPALITLGMRSDAESQSVLREFAVDTANGHWRAAAVYGLARSAADSAETQQILLDILRTESSELGWAAIQALRGAARPEMRAAVIDWWARNRDSKELRDSRIDLEELVLLTLKSGLEHAPAVRLPEPITAAAERRPKDLEGWRAELARSGDERSGEFVFFHPRGPQCSKCHRVNGRGGSVGPDLSTIGRTLDRDKLIRSILEPSKDISPQFTTWLVATRDGQLHTGIILREDPRGTITLGDAQGKTIDIPVAEIEQRQAQTQSIMPDDLTDQITRREFADLVEFLSNLK